VVLISRAVALAHSRAESDAAPALDGRLRESLAGRSLVLPPLRTRLDDLTRLMDAEASKSFGAALPRSAFSAAALQRLQAHLWPGNERELHGLVAALLSRARNGPIQPEDLAPHLGAALATAAHPRSEKDRIVDALWRHGFNRSRTAEALGISRKTLYNKIRKFGLDG
jgi:transcriptional regulator of acetoin/glycerol metabolism